MSIEVHGISHVRSQGTVDAAYRFALHWHGDQKRKYTGEPYIVHPIEVAQIVASVTEGIELIAMAFTHDLLEDTTVTDQDFMDFGLGFGILRGTKWLTDEPKEFGNRAARKAADLERLAAAPVDVKTVKLADMISNTPSIIQHDANFAKVWMNEKQALLEVLEGGDPVLFKRAGDLIMDYYLGRKT